jgi:hypothetical protein
MPKPTEHQAIKQVQHHIEHLFYAVTDALSIGMSTDEIRDEIEEVLVTSDLSVLPAIQVLVEAISDNWDKAQKQAAAITAIHAQAAERHVAALEAHRNNALALAEADEKVREAQFQADNLRQEQRLKGLGV